MNWLKKRPWIWIVLAFVVLITSWVWLLRLAIETQPESVPLQTRTVHDDGR